VVRTQDGGQVEQMGRKRNAVLRQKKCAKSQASNRLKEEKKKCSPNQNVGQRTNVFRKTE